MTSPVARPTTRLYCRSTNAYATSRSGRDTPCGQLMGDVPGVLRFLAIVPRAPELPDGKVYQRCSRCNAWNVWVIEAES